MKQTIAAALLIGLLASPATTAHACSCIIPDVSQAFDRADAVFIGTVTEIVAPRTTDEKAPLPGRFFTIKFKVEKSWKGVAPAAREFNVLSAQGRYGCFAYSPGVVKGERYLVYADPASGVGGKGWSIITSCNRTSAMGFAPGVGKEIDPQSDIRELDAMAPPSLRFGFAPSLKVGQGFAGELR